ncbi:MAG TPA: hypothetical protein VGQ64_10380 [Candidatus Limnocylindrales bacterium]|nr:hypothetical protein [Candidatus Limnocylindrales bacterium]
MFLTSAGRAPRSRIVIQVIALLTASVAAACGSAIPDVPASPPVAPPPTMRPDIACEIEHGMRLVEVQPPRFEGDVPHYRVERNAGMSPQEEAAIEFECIGLLPERAPPTDAEVTAVYNRWLEEHACLVRLGYKPDDPPVLERFLVEYKTGPWTPVDGVDTRRWTTDEFRLAKASCILEMIDQR